MLTKIINLLKKLDFMLLSSVLILCSIGLLEIYSIELSRQDDFTNFKKQLAFVLVGFLLLLIVASINTSFYRTYSRVFYVVGFVALLAVLFFGSTIRGTKGWFYLGIINVQPVEFAKFALIIFLSRFFSKRLQQFNQWRHLWFGALGTILYLVLVGLQPDFGSALILFFIWIIMLAVTGLKKQYWVLMIVIALIASIVGWSFFLADYQRERIQVFLQPDLDPLGAGYNVMQAIIAVGAGSMWGRGLGFGSQSQLKFIPESQTDFIFAAIAEELGFLGVLLVIIPFILIFYRLLLAAKKTNDDFHSFILIGIAAMFFVHFVVNIGMNIGLMPVTGVSLPFLSYGGSFLLMSLVMIGVAEGVIVNSKA